MKCVRRCLSSSGALTFVYLRFFTNTITLPTNEYVISIKRCFTAFLHTLQTTLGYMTARERYSDGNFLRTLPRALQISAALCVLFSSSFAHLNLSNTRQLLPPNSSCVCVLCCSGPVSPALLFATFTAASIIPAAHTQKTTTPTTSLWSAGRGVARSCEMFDRTKHPSEPNNAEQW